MGTANLAEVEPVYIVGKAKVARALFQYVYGFVGHISLPQAFTR